MSIVCPHCRNSFALKQPKPGRYKPKCPKCQEPFLLTISADGQPQSAPLPQSGTEATLSPTQTKPAVAQTPAPTAALNPSQRTTPAIEQTIDATPPSPAAPIPPAAKTTASPAATMPLATEAAVDFTVQPAPANVQATLAPSAATVGVDATVALNQPTTGILATAKAPVLGGYRLLTELGRGAMGAVYLAKQISLDREVAVKTIQGEWADNPVFIARFTREAFAAAQLSHHNVVQIYDLGVDQNIHFFSMEYVRGQSLDAIVKQKGKLDAETALRYVLQAARGLQYAHSRGLVHRDVKPANLILSEHGQVKVADLGLVKNIAEDEPATTKKPLAPGKPAALTAMSASVTAANVAMGTPAYMAPEQAENAAAVDHRADIYSLGCTLYVLLTGRPPFEGSSALEVITKHRTEPVVRPDLIVRRLPAALSDITLKMVAKKPEDRYQHLGEAIRAMEEALGLPSTTNFSPSEEQVETVERCAAAFHAPPIARQRRLAILGFSAAMFVLLLITLPFSFWAASCVAGLFVAATLSYFVLSGFFERTYLFNKVRQLVLTMRWTDWLTAGGGFFVLLLVLMLLGLLGTAISMTVLGAVLGGAVYFYFDKRLAAQRRPALDEMRGLIKSLRLQGHDEQAIRHFVARNSGENWEEFFEALFGFEAKLQTRQTAGLNDQGQPRPKFRAWRETIVRTIDGRLAAVEEARNRRLLQQVEEKNLQAQGLDLITARKQAQRVADALVDDAAQARRAVASPQGTVPDPKLEAMKKRAQIKAMLAEARAGHREPSSRNVVRSLFAPIGWFFGPRARFLVGCLLLAGCVLWAHQNGLLTRENADTIKAAVTEGVQARDAQQVADNLKASLTTDTVPLQIPMVGASLPMVGDWFNSINPGIAGLILIFSSLFQGVRMTVFMLPAAAAMIAAPALDLYDLQLLPHTHLLGLAVGLGIAVVGFFFGRTYD